VRKKKSVRNRLTRRERIKEYIKLLKKRNISKKGEKPIVITTNDIRAFLRMEQRSKKEKGTRGTGFKLGTKVVTTNRSYVVLNTGAFYRTNDLVVNGEVKRVMK